jgi:heme exporter protein D
MQWNSVGEFFAMGGYGLYVWGSFGACAALMVAEPLLAKRRLNEVRKSLVRERLADELDHQSGTP